MLSLCRRLISSTELAAVSLLIVALVLLGIPLRVSLASSVLLIVAVVWQCAVGISIWVRVIKPTRVELVDILGPCLATGAAFTALGWFALCRISWITPRLFALSTVVVAIDGVRLLKTRYQKSDDRQTPVIAVSIAILGLGYHRIALLALGVGLLTLLIITNAVKPSLKTSLDKSFVEKFATTKKLVISTTGLLIVICAMALQALISRNNIVGFVPGSDENYGEAIALGVTPNTNLDLSPFNSNFRYHWLSHGWLGVMIRSFKLEPFVGTAVLVPLIVLTSTVCLVFSAFKKWRGSGVLVPIITAMLIVAGCSVSDQLVFATDGSTSNQFGTLWLILGGYLLLSFLNETTKVSITLVGSALLGFLVMGTKGPLAIVLISAACAQAAYSIYKRQLFFKSILCVIALLTGSSVSYLILAGGSSQQSSMKFVNPMNSFASIIFLMTFLITTRIPFVYVAIPLLNDFKYRFLALGASFAMVFASLLSIVDSELVYFRTGAIALGCFFGGLSSDLTIKNERIFLKIIVFLSSIIFLISFYYHSKSIYLSVLPEIVSHETSDSFREIILNLQKIMVYLFSGIILVGYIARQIKNKKIQVALIYVMFATTVGVFVADGSSSELRQLAINNNGLNGGPPDSALVAKSVIKSANWLKEHSKNSSIIATNYTSDGYRSVGYLVSTATQRPVLVESLNYVSQNSLITEFDRKVKLTLEFANLPNSTTTKALTNFGVDYYLFDITGAQISSSDLCAENEIWRCEYKNKYSVVLKFLTKN